MTNGPLFHGKSVANVKKYYEGNFTIPKRWTTGPIEALSYALAFSIGSQSSPLVWVIENWSHEHFSVLGESSPRSFMGIDDGEGQFWYENKQNPFASVAERESGVKRYTESDLEEYLSKYMEDEKAATIKQFLGM